jgi:hypothetical protein
MSDSDFEDLFDGFADPGSVACEGDSHSAPSLLSATESDCHNSIPDLWSVADSDDDRMPDLWWPDSDGDSSMPDIESVADSDGEDDGPHLQSVADINSKELSEGEDAYLHSWLPTPPLSIFAFTNIMAGGGDTPPVTEPIPNIVDVSDSDVSD